MFTGMNDHASCFHCNGGLHNWDPNDDPWEEHARWFSRCPYVNIIKGQDYIQEVLKDKPPIISVDELNLNGAPTHEDNNEHGNEEAETGEEASGEIECLEEAAATVEEPNLAKPETEENLVQNGEIEERYYK